MLNRIIRWLDHSIEYECDPRQIERLVAECGLEGAKAVATPGVKATFQELHEDSAELPGHLTTAFRGAAARGNYLAADRLDVQFACKEVCRWMSRPSLHAWKAMKRLCRYLAGAPRLVYVFEQQTVDSTDVYTDTDWSGCPLTRKSTSGGCVMMGKHAVKHWSSTQTSISLSSGEAEFAGVIRGAGQGLGYQALLKDVGAELPLRVWTDSSAALGICSRQGLGKLRHLDTHTLWIQQAVRTKRVDLRKVDGEANPADLLTKHSLSRQRLEDLVALYGCRYRDGRAESAPSVRKGASSRMTMAAADQEIGGVTEPTVLMPHLTRTPEELDQLHPSLIPPEDEPLEDLVKDAEDAVYQKGLELSDEIRRETSLHGRRKTPTVASLHRSNNSDKTQSQGKVRAGEMRSPVMRLGDSAAGHAAQETRTTPRESSRAGGRTLFTKHPPDSGLSRKASAAPQDGRAQTKGRAQAERPLGGGVLNRVARSSVKSSPSVRSRSHTRSQLLARLSR